MSLPIPIPTFLEKKIHSFVGEIKHETMSKRCKPMERHMLAGTGRESFLRQMKLRMDSEGLVKIGKTIHFVCPDFIEHLLKL